MTTETVTQLYDELTEASQELSGVIDDLDPEDDAFTPPEVVDAREQLREINSRLSGAALNAYNATEYAESMDRKQRKAEASSRAETTGEPDQ